MFVLNILRSFISKLFTLLAQELSLHFNKLTHIKNQKTIKTAREIYQNIKRRLKYFSSERFLRQFALNHTQKINYNNFNSIRDWVMSDWIFSDHLKSGNTEIKKNMYKLQLPWFVWMYRHLYLVILARTKHQIRNCLRSITSGWLKEFFLPFYDFSLLRSLPNLS